MYPLQNPKPHFLPYDVCRVVGTEQLVLIMEVNCNTGQTEDEWQWSYSGQPLDPKLNQKFAWFQSTELKRLCNIFEIIAKESAHPFGNKAYKFNLIGHLRDDK